MKNFSKYIALCIFIILVTGCNKSNSKIVVKSVPDKTEVTEKKIQHPAEKVIYEVSTFDDPKLAEQTATLRKDLKELDDTGVFSKIHAAQMAKLSDSHYGFLKGLRKNYKLLYVANGSLFNAANDDKAMVVYDPEKQLISILLYNSRSGNGGELYRDFKVLNGLKEANCHYSNFGTLDYRVAASIAYMKDSLLNNPESLSEKIPCLITNFTKNENYAPAGGCTSPKAAKNHGTSLCIATDFVYNNWECLQYSSAANAFLIYYGQAFAD